MTLMPHLLDALPGISIILEILGSKFSALTKNERFGIQRMEILVIYFALVENLKNIKRIIGKHRKRRVIIAVRSERK